MCHHTKTILQVHHSRDRDVGSLFARQGVEKHNKMSCYFLFSSYHNTMKKKSRFKAVFFFFFFFSVSFCTERYAIYFSVPHTRIGAA